MTYLLDIQVKDSSDNRLITHYELLVPSEHAASPELLADYMTNNPETGPFLSRLVSSMRNL
jgi:hypothetical protein